MPTLIAIQAEQAAEPPSFRAAFEELGHLLSQPGVPRTYLDGLAQIVDRIDKCLVVKLQPAATAVANDADSMLQPSDLFMDYLAAVRARDWPKVGIIQHEFRPRDGVVPLGQ